ncbi:MAG TPA: hypothetical protein VEH09_08250, partial [Thermodesulfobacteriota bacterium]|nr:hypothetical protein [Thermodesulfobacteriota bacterium]
TISFLYSPPILCNGRNVNGQTVKAAKIKPRIYWVLLAQYNSNGYRGVIAEEDQLHFALSNRNIVQDQVILPLLNDRGTRISYNLEPIFPVDTIDPQRNIPWDFSFGQLSIQITDPSGERVDLGTSPFTGQKGQWPTTGNLRFTAWKPSEYGQYTAVVKGWIADRWGNRYHGGGTYRFWIARRMTMATATFQGMSFPVGSTYGRDISFFPAVPAEVTVKVDLYPGSDPARVKSLIYRGKASSGGVFGVSQGLKPFPLDEPGEYHAHVLATYKDLGGHLWVCSMRHAGVVYPADTNLVAHGKKIRIDNQLVDRGETHYEGYIEPNDDFRHLDHINFPYRAGDVLLIASEGQGANKIEPVLTYEFKDRNEPYDPRLQPIGATNARIMTSNGLSPHLYPEYITDRAYYYAAAPRPGFPSRFLIGEDGVRAPYWPTSATNFGGQIGASNNGDQPGDIYRLLGGVVLLRHNQQPLYTGYMASAFILPRGTKNNRIIAPGAEDLIGADGRRSRFFLVPVRPGMVYIQNTFFVPALQIDPIVPAHIHFVLSYPDGKEKIADGIGDHFGSFVGVERWQLDQPGVYIYSVKASWEGHEGSVPGLPAEGGYLFVIENSRPAGATGLRLALKEQQSFLVENGLMIEGRSTAEVVYFAVVTPGAIIDQGQIPVQGGAFRYRLDPEAVHRRIPIYDIENLRTGRKEIGRVIHLTFFSREKSADRAAHHAFARVIVRGTTAIYTS